MGHALHVAPASVAEAVERNRVVQRPTAGGVMEYRCGCMDHPCVRAMVHFFHSARKFRKKILL